ncbi:hypothetical protein GIY56_00680 [Paracoccus sp. YIM 132242]|uniref:Uncharacterized protein n=1 Tax=Paracoccus lichenicola TaxID=2665644 RepID=A0A6L6HJR3_9RHOB|nr:hypothetical protein [Paracoccus lichenicola]MTD98798.1 hypothetical protein [Paracoccus lichenicola]
MTNKNVDRVSITTREGLVFDIPFGHEGMSVDARLSMVRKAFEDAFGLFEEVLTVGHVSGVA